jgi:hypothetical protein
MVADTQAALDRSNARITQLETALRGLVGASRNVVHSLKNHAYTGAAEHDYASAISKAREALNAKS